MMKFLLVSSILFAVMVFAGLPAQAQTSLGGIIINADNSEYNSKTKVAHLKGHVQVVFQGNHMSADEATVSMETKQIHAEGNVVLQNPKVYAGADQLDYNFDTNTGVFYNSFIKSGQTVLEGQVIEKTGENEYIAKDANFSTCETCPPAWSFSGKKITAELGGYAWITRPILRVAGLPVLILPGIVFPLKSKRQSGFLVPSYNYSESGGHAVTQSYFWAISRSSDMTITGRNYEKRGFKSLGEYRYVLSDKNRGELRGAHIRDSVLANDDPFVDGPIDRWYIDYGHRFEMPGDIVQRARLISVSDLRYPTDFPKEIDANGDPSLKNQISITKKTEDQLTSAEATINVNLLKANPLASNEDAVHRLPEINYHYSTSSIGSSNFTGKLHANYVNFTRSGIAYDDIEPCANGTSRCVKEQRDGKFDVDSNGEFSDVIRTGQRLDFTPTLAYPMLWGEAIEFVPQVKYRETQYYFNLGTDDTVSENYANNASRRYIETQLSAGMQFTRLFGSIDENSHKGQKYKHEFEPKVAYVTFPWIQRPKHRFFGDFSNRPISHAQEPVSNADLNYDSQTGMQFDYNDRVFDTRYVSLSLSNKIVRKRWAGSDPDYRSLVIAKLEQKYDINEAQSADKPQPWQPVNGVFDLRFDNFDSYTEAIHYPYAQVTNFSTRWRYVSDGGNSADITYRRDVRVDEQNTILENTKTETVGLGFGIVTKYLNLSAGMDYDNITFEVQTWRAAAVIKPPGDCVAFYATGLLGINGDPQFDLNVEFNFSGF